MARTTLGILQIKPLWQMAWYTAISLLGSFRTGVLILWTLEAIGQRASRWRVTRNVEHRQCVSPSKFGATSRTSGRQLRPWCWIRCVRKPEQFLLCECAHFEPCIWSETTAAVLICSVLMSIDALSYGLKLSHNAALFRPI